MIPSIDRTRSTRVTVLAVAVLLSVLALSMAFTGSAAAAVDSADRTISSTETPNGTTVTVTVDATFDSTTSQGQINDVISPNISDSNVVITDSGFSGAYQESSGTVTSTYFDTKSATLSYEVTIPADASVGTTYDFANGTVADREAGDEISISGDETITVIKGDSDDPSSPDDSPSGDGSIVSAERTIDSDKAIAGDTVGVTVTASFDGTASTAEITDTISFKPDSTNVTITEAEGATVSSYQPSSGNVFASWGSKESVTLSYDVTIPESASAGDTYDFSGEVDNGDTTSSVAGNSTVEVVTDPLVAYAGPSGVVGTKGLGDAAADFRAGKIGAGILGDVAGAFRSGEPV